MKKLLLAAFIILMTAGAVFAQTYTVERITGLVQKETAVSGGGSTRVNLKVGDNLTANTIIHTAAEAVLVLKFGERLITIPASRSGRVSELSASGLRVTGNVTRVDTTAVERTGGQTTTASARAADAANDPDIAEE